MLEALRKGSAGILAKILFLLLMVSFGIWGVGDMVGGAIGGSSVADVGDVAITGEEFDEEFNREVGRLKQQLGDIIDRDKARAFGMDQQVLQRMVSRALFKAGAQDLGVTAPDEKVVEAVQATEAFKTEAGSFSRLRFNDALRNAGLSEGRYLALVRGDLINGQYTQSLQSGVSAPETLAKALYAYSGEKRTAEKIVIGDHQVPAPAQPTEDQLVTYHKDNAPQFTAPEYRAVTALVVTAQDVAKNTEVSDEEIQVAYDDRADEFKTPEKRTLRQMVLTSEDDAKKATALLAEGVSFEDVAKVVAKMEAAALDLGAVERDGLLPEMADPAFTAAAGTVTAPIKSPLGWHLVEVLSVQPATVKTLDQVRTQLRDAIAQDKSLDGLYSQVNQIEDQLGGGATLEETARALGLKPVVIPAIDRTGADTHGKKVMSAPQRKEFLDTAFTTDVGADSLMVDAGGDIFFVLRVDGVTAPELKPLASVRGDVIDGYMKKAKQSAAESTAKEVLSKAQSGTDLASLAAALNLKATQTEPFARDTDDLPQDIVKALFDGKIGTVAMARSTNAYTVARLTGIQSVDTANAKTEVAAMSKALEDAIAADILGQLAEGLRTEHPVSINAAALAQRFTQPDQN